MKFPCEIVVKDILPVVRALLAKKLVYEYGFKQTAVALMLGTSQASINYYLRSKRGYKSKIVKELKGLEETIEKIAEGLAQGELTQIKILEEVCDICMKLRARNTICEMHEAILPTIKGQNCKICMEYTKR